MLSKLWYLSWMIVKRGGPIDAVVFGLAGFFFVISLLSLSWLAAAFCLLVKAYVMWSVVCRGQG